MLVDCMDDHRRMRGVPYLVGAPVDALVRGVPGMMLKRGRYRPYIGHGCWNRLVLTPRLLTEGQHREVWLARMRRVGLLHSWLITRVRSK